MATPNNSQYQLELYQEFERHLPGRWFKRLRNQDGALYPLLWGLCGALAGLRENIEAARGQAIPIESEGFWLSLHLLGLGLARRSGESDAQARTRYQFEFSPTRNTRAGLLRQIEAHSGLESPEVRLETNFGKGLLGELTLTVATNRPWTEIDWWWLRPFFEEWVANGLSRKASISTAGLETVALRPWDFYTRFPTGPDLLKPFWERPAFLSELRIFEFARQLEARSTVLGLEGEWWFDPTETYSLPAAGGYVLPVAIAPLTLVPSALTDSPISRNVLGWVCLENWEVEALRIAEIWRNLSTTQQPGEVFIYLGDDGDCQTLQVPNIQLPSAPFPTDDPIEILGYGPWRLKIGQGEAIATTIVEPVATLIQAGQWWMDAAGEQRSQVPIPLDDGSVRWQLEFLLPKSDEPFWLRELEITLGYTQDEYNVTLDWSLPAAEEWLEPLAGGFELLSGTDPRALTPNLPPIAAIHYRRVDILIPAGVNLGLLFDLSTEPV